MTRHIITPPPGNTHKPWPALLAGLAILAATAASPAQTKTTPPPFTSVPKVENVVLYHSFFVYHQNLVNANQALKNANPAQGPALDQQMAALLGVNISELPAVVANTQQVVQAQANLAAASSASAISRGAQAVQLTMSQRVSQHELQRARITVEGIRALNQSLSPASWTAIHAFILGPFKSQLSIH